MSEEKKNTEDQNIEEKGFWTKNIISIILIVFLIVSGVYAFNRDTEDKTVEDKVEEIKKEGEEATETEETETKSEEVATENTDIQKSETQITIKANIGDGVTHLARRAVAEYSKDKEITLSKEQKIYAETILKNKYYQQYLNLSQEVQFELSDLEDTVQNAQNLSENEIKAWSKYSHLVPSL